MKNPLVLVTVLFLVLPWHSRTSAQTPITYKVWCTPITGGEKEYSIPNNILSTVTLPVEIPDYGRVVCSVQNYEGREKTDSQSAEDACMVVDLSTVQQLQPAKEGGYQPITIFHASFALVYNQRVKVLETSTYSISIELLKK